MRRTLALNLLAFAVLAALVEAGGQVHYWWTTGASLRTRSLQSLEDAPVRRRTARRVVEQRRLRG